MKELIQYFLENKRHHCVDKIREIIVELMNDSNVEFDCENIIVEEISRGEDGIRYNRIGFRNSKNGVEYFLGAAGGDWEWPVYFVLYKNDKNKYNMYIPDRGQLYNTETFMAFGNDYELDFDVIDRMKSKLQVNEVFDGDYSDPLEYFQEFVGVYGDAIMFVEMINNIDEFFESGKTPEEFYNRDGNKSRKRLRAEVIDKLCECCDEVEKFGGEEDDDKKSFLDWLRTI